MRRPGQEERTELNIRPGSDNLRLHRSRLCRSLQLNEQQVEIRMPTARLRRSQSPHPVAKGACGRGPGEGRWNQRRKAAVHSAFLFSAKRQPSLSGIFLAWRLVLEPTCHCPGMTSRRVRANRSLGARMRRDELATRRPLPLQIH